MTVLSDANAFIGKALVVDDMTDMLTLLSLLMKVRLNCHVDCADSVPKAREILLNNTYDVIISDYHIGRETGADFLRFLIQEQIELPFFFYTGHGGLDARDFQHLDYPLVVIQKPNADALLKAIAEVMEWPLKIQCTTQ